MGADRVALDRAASAVFEDFHVNGHALNDYESATVVKIAVSAYLDALVSELPEEAVEAAARAARPTLWAGEDMYPVGPATEGERHRTTEQARDAIRAFLSALQEQKP